MARPKRNSLILERSQRHLESLQAIDTWLDFGNGISLQAYTDLITQTRQTLSHYNKLLTMVDDAMQDVVASEEALTRMSKRLKQNIAARYGDDSREYQMAGGKVRSTRRRSSSSSPVIVDATTPPAAIKNGTKD